MTFAALLLLAIAAALAVEMSRRGAGHAARAWLLRLAVGADVLQLLLGRALADSPAPYTGSARVAFHASQVLFLAWPAGVASLAVRTLARTMPWPVAILWALAAFAVVAGYPRLRGDELENVLRAWHLLCLAIGMVSIVAFWMRRGTPRSAHELAIVLVAGELLVAVGPYRLGIWRAWAVSELGSKRPGKARRARIATSHRHVLH